MEPSEDLYNVLSIVPAMVAITRGPDHIYEFANPSYLKIVGKTKNIIGKSIVGIFPELQGQGILEILDNVYRTGREYRADEQLILLDTDNDGKPEEKYFSFVYLPVRGAGGEITGVMSHALEVSQQVQARRQAEENETRYRSLFNSIDEGFCVIEMIYDAAKTPVDYRFVETNKVFESQTGLINATGKSIKELQPDIEEIWIERYGKVAASGRSTRFVEHSPALDRWFDVHASRIGGAGTNRVAVLFKDVTATKKSEDLLRHSEERFRTLIEKSTDAIQLVDVDGNILYSSESLKNVLGYTPQELQGTGVGPYLHPDDAEGFYKKFAELIKSPRKSMMFEYRVKHKDGSWAWVETTGVNHLKTPNIQALVGTFRNITARKLAEEQTQYQKSLLESQQEVSPLGILIVSEAGKIVSYNRRFATMWRLPQRARNQDIDQIALEAVTAQLTDPAEFTKRVQTIYAGQISSNDRLHFVDGRIFDRYGAPLFGDDKRYRGYVWYFLDITEERRATIALKASERRLRFMAESMPQLIFTADAEGKVDYLNSQWAEYSGTPIKALRRSSVRHLLHPDDLDDDIRLWKQALASGRSFQNQQRLLRADGTYRHHISHVRPMLGKDGKVVRWVGSITDIEDVLVTTARNTELEQIAAALEEQHAQLIAVNKAKDEFISLASHQLRTPATGVKQYIGMLLEGFAGEVTDEQQRFLQSAYDSNERQLKIVNDLLKVASVDSGKVTLRLEPTPLVPLIDGILAEMASQFAAKQQKVTFEHHGANYAVSADTHLLRMVLENLIDNAQKYTYEGKSIIIKLLRHARDIQIDIRDEGVGILSQDIEKLGEKFKRLDNPLSSQVGGTGLGLYWVKKVIDLHAGKLVITSTEGSGSTFSIRLTRADQ